jgi:hypothetical protein
VPWYLLTRLDGSLVTVELHNGDEIVLIFDDRDEAVAVGTVMDAESGVDPVGLVTVEQDGAIVARTIAEYARIRSDLRALKPLLPGDPLHAHLVRAVLRR